LGDQVRVLVRTGQNGCLKIVLCVDSGSALQLKSACYILSHATGVRKHHIFILSRPVSLNVCSIMGNSEMPTTLLINPTDGVPPDLIPPLLNLRSDSLLLSHTIGPHASLVLRGRCPDRLVRLGVFLELVDEVVKVLLLLLPVLQRPFLQLGVVALYPRCQWDFHVSDPDVCDMP